MQEKVTNMLYCHCYMSLTPPNPDRDPDAPDPSTVNFNLDRLYRALQATAGRVARSLYAVRVGIRRRRGSRAVASPALT